MPKSALIYKEVGETPLEALEKYRSAHPELKDVPMTYAGRLDPMAEGELLILIGEECKNKEKYLGLDKEYEVEIVFGITTDTYDALGLVTDLTKSSSNIHPSLDRYVGRFNQEYPAYSSKTFKGKQLHELARAGELPDTDDIPTKEVEIYSIEPVNAIPQYGAAELEQVVLGKISRIHGDFRQNEIVARWKEILSDRSLSFKAIKIMVKCSSGTYMRSLAHRIGKDLDVGAFALSIKRTEIYQ